MVHAKIYLQYGRRNENKIEEWNKNGNYFQIL
jgi:hypothetical protein